MWSSVLKGPAPPPPQVRRCPYAYGRKEHLDSTLSSVYVTTESHEKRIRVADQCAFTFRWQFHAVSIFNPLIFANLNHRWVFPPFTYLERKVRLKFDTYRTFSSTARAIPS